MARGAGHVCNGPMEPLIPGIMPGAGHLAKSWMFVERFWSNLVLVDFWSIFGMVDLPAGNLLRIEHGPLSSLIYPLKMVIFIDCP